MKTITPEQQALIAAIQGTFGNGPFCVPKVVERTYFCPQLVTAIEAALPGCQWWNRHGEVKPQSYGALSRLLNRLAQQHFITDPKYCEWYLKDPVHD
jgi:hypothetical protein